MNNDDLKRFLKEQINFDIKDCLPDIKDVEVDVLPSHNKKHLQYGKAFKYGLYSLLGVSILGSSSLTAYNYVTPTTYVAIEIDDAKENLSTRGTPNIMFKIDLNSFNKVIGTDCNIDYVDFLDCEHMDYKQAIPLVIDYLHKLSLDDKQITFTVISEDDEKCEDIENFFSKIEKSLEDLNVFINSSVEDQNSSLSIGKQRAIDLIMKKNAEYDRKALEKKSIRELLKILFD